MTALHDWPWLRELWDRKNGRMYSGPVRTAADLVRLHKSAGGLCFHCGKITELTIERHDLQATRDHFIPRSKGGGDAENIVLSCYRCNQDKGDTMPGLVRP